jgi:hypothetical protein
MVMGYPGFEQNRFIKPDKSILEEPTVGVVSKVEAKIGVPYKTIIAFLTVFLGQLWARATVDGIPVIPDTVGGWGALIGGSFIAAIGVYFKANVYTVPQAEQKLNTATEKAIKAV